MTIQRIKGLIYIKEWDVINSSGFEGYSQLKLVWKTGKKWTEMNCPDVLGIVIHIKDHREVGKVQIINQTTPWVED